MNAALDVLIHHPGPGSAVFVAVRRAAPGGPLRLSSVLPDEAGQWRCRFVPQRPELVVADASVDFLLTRLAESLTVIHPSRTASAAA